MDVNSDFTARRRLNPSSKLGIGDSVPSSLL
jgi:hypothetical protein